MITSNLLLHRGARVVTREEVDQIAAPPETKSWFPLRHGLVLDTVLSTLTEASFGIKGMQLSLSSDNARFFGTLVLATPIAEGTTLAVGVRNSIDKTFPLGFCAGCRVFVCDNLAFHSELLVARKEAWANSSKRKPSASSACEIMRFLTNRPNPSCSGRLNKGWSRSGRSPR